MTKRSNKYLTALEAALWKSMDEGLWYALANYMDLPDFAEDSELSLAIAEARLAMSNLDKLLADRARTHGMDYME